VIEDDVETAEPLANYVGNAGHVVDIAVDGEGGLSTSCAIDREQSMSAQVERLIFRSGIGSVEEPPEKAILVSDHPESGGCGFKRRRDVPGPSRDDSFAALVLPHLDAAHNLARWLVRDGAAAEDVVQDAVLRALTYFSGSKSVNPRAWLLQIVRNTAYISRQVDRGAKLVPIGDAAEPGAVTAVNLVADADDPETALLRSRDRCRARQLIAELPVELREPLVLRELEEMPYKQIAAVTGAPIGTVMSRLFRARRLLLAHAAGGDEK
jgi:RNA polymerase sigma-70 factor (ECF subfamily)